MSNIELAGIVLIIVISLIFVALNYVFGNTSIKDFLGCGFALSGLNDASVAERERVLVPQSDVSEEDMRKQKLRSIPFFCAAILFVFLTIVDLGDYPYFPFYAAMMLYFGFFVRRYRRSYYVRKGKILRNITDLLFFVAWSGWSGVNSLIPEDYEYDYVVLGSCLMFFIIALILQSLMRKCEVEK